MTPRRDRWRELRRAVTWHRRLLAAGLAAAAVTAGLHVLSPPATEQVVVLAAARDLPAGTTIGASDLTTVALPPDVVPAGTLAAGADILGRSVAGPVRSGEPLTDVRLVGPTLLHDLGPDLVATPVRVADPGSVAFVRPGDRIDLLATPVGLGGDAGATRTVAAAVVVLAVPLAVDEGSWTSGALLVVATTAAQAAELAGAAVTSRLALTVRGSSDSLPSSADQAAGAWSTSSQRSTS